MARLPGEFELQLRMKIQSNDDFAMVLERLQVAMPRAAIAVILDLIDAAEDIEFRVTRIEE